MDFKRTVCFLPAAALLFACGCKDSGAQGGGAGGFFYPESARSAAIKHPPVSLEALKNPRLGGRASFADIKPEWIKKSCVRCHINRGVDTSMPALRGAGGEKGEAYYLGGKNGTVFFSNSRAFEQPSPAVAMAGLEKNFNAGEAFFEGNFVADKNSPFGGLGPTYVKTSCLACHPGYGRARRTDNFAQEYGNGYIATVHNPDGTIAKGYTPMLQTKSVKPYLPYAKGVKITWREFKDKYSNRYPDGTPYNAGTKYEGSLVYPEADIIEPLLPLPQDYKVSIEATIGIYGTGLLDAIKDEDILAECERQHSFAGPVKGAHGKWVLESGGQKRLGKFSWHCFRATLGNGPGANGIHTITNVNRADRPRLYATKEWFEFHRARGIDVSELERPQPPSLSMQDYENFMVWHRGLGVPAARNLEDPRVQNGRKIFFEIGCASCHKPQWTTGEYKPLPGYSNQTIRPYTDMLMHDMGAENKGRFRTYRTPPLWGRGLMHKTAGHTDMFHDLRARNFEEAVLWHFGEAEFARELFRSLSKSEREDLLKFLKSL